MSVRLTSLRASVPDKPALILAGSGRVVTHGELDLEATRARAWLGGTGLGPGDAIAVLMGNDPYGLVVCRAALRAGVPYVALDSTAGAAALAAVIDEIRPAAIVINGALLGLATKIQRRSSNAVRLLASEGGGHRPDTSRDGAKSPAMPSRRTARPVAASDDDVRPGLRILETLGADADARFLFAGMTLCDPRLMRAAMALTGLGATVVLLEHFDAEAVMVAIEQHRITHSLCTTAMFTRLLALPPNVRTRYDLSSHAVAVHGASACPVSVKKQMLDWWGPILHECYPAAGGLAITHIGPQDWLEHPGSVGKPVVGTVRVVGDNGDDLPPRRAGWLRAAGDAAGDRVHAVTTADSGYIDDGGWLYVTDRRDETVVYGFALRQSVK